jgi:hypothetical protein
MSDPQQTNAYDEYAKNDDFIITTTKTDYAVMMKDTLNQILGTLLAEQPQSEYLIGLTRTAMDYLFYLEDNRRVIV